ncbi:MAG: helix-turn-helix transcriptional regulator [Chloroflexi bacterium]|nr:MAG: helix-turn-helix transcriptional regulator [Chloroflexota bacterium]
MNGRRARTQEARGYHAGRDVYAKTPHAPPGGCPAARFPRGEAGLPLHQGLREGRIVIQVVTAKRRQVHYRWRLREIMASRGLFSTTDLAPLLVERGIERSQAQVWRLVTGTPERLSLEVLAALCDILDVTPADLIVTSAVLAP